jgi:hypothetical protein
MIDYHVSKDLDSIITGLEESRNGQFVSGDTEHSSVVDSYNAVVWSSGDALLALVDQLLLSNDPRAVRIAGQYTSPSYALKVFNPFEFYGDGVGDILVELAGRPSNPHIKDVLAEAIASMRLRRLRVPPQQSIGQIPLSTVSVAALLDLSSVEPEDHLRIQYLSGLSGLIDAVPEVRDYLAWTILDDRNPNSMRQTAAIALNSSSVDIGFALEVALAMLTDPSIDIKIAGTKFFSWLSFEHESPNPQLRNWYFNALLDRFNDSNIQIEEFRGSLALRLIEIDDPEFAPAVLESIRTKDVLSESSASAVLEALQSAFVFAAVRSDSRVLFPLTREMIVNELKEISRDLSRGRNIREEAFLALGAIAFYRMKHAETAGASELISWVEMTSSTQGIDFKALSDSRLRQVVTTRPEPD